MSKVRTRTARVAPIAAITDDKGIPPMSDEKSAMVIDSRPRLWWRMCLLPRRSGSRGCSHNIFWRRDNWDTVNSAEPKGAQ